MAAFYPYDGLILVALAMTAALLAVMSLVSSDQRRETVREGFASHADLCELTGIFDPRELQDVFGPPDFNRVWAHVTLAEVQAARRPMGWFLSSDAVDWACIAIGVLAIFIRHPFVEGGIVLAFLVQSIAWLVVFKLPKQIK